MNDGGIMARVDADGYAVNCHEIRDTAEFADKKQRFEGLEVMWLVGMPS